MTFILHGSAGERDSVVLGGFDIPLCFAVEVAKKMVGFQVIKVTARVE